jgi:hypothetical protein
MTSLDCADPSMRVDKRNESISAPQALAMLNNGFMVTQARYFAERLQKAGGTLEGQVDLACRLALGHELGGRERESLLSFAREHGLPNFCRVVLNLNEFSFID